MYTLKVTSIWYCFRCSHLLKDWRADMVISSKVSFRVLRSDGRFSIVASCRTRMCVRRMFLEENKLPKSRRTETRLDAVGPSKVVLSRELRAVGGLGGSAEHWSRREGGHQILSVNWPWTGPTRQRLSAPTDRSA